jgi:hypothetical protein
MLYFCCDERRREAIKAHGTLNGIDVLEVVDRDAPSTVPEIARQKTLLVRFFKPIPELTADNVAIEGGVRRTPVKVVWASRASSVPTTHATAQEQAWFGALPQADHVLVVRTDSTGDHSHYRLILRKGQNDPLSPDDFDPRLSSVEFSFKVDCPSEFDCHQIRVCPPDQPETPDIDYLAKDYTSFRQLMLDRMALLTPAGGERQVADLGIALVELLAYKADRLSYQEDAIGTEGYLSTARRRISVRRHARLVDYFMHDGSNARTWVQVTVDADTVLPPGTQLLTKTPHTPQRIAPLSQDYHRAMQERPVVFETMHEVALFEAHNRLELYTWGDRRCCLPKGATHATLKGKQSHLERGMVLILSEQRGPRTGAIEDADPARQHAVRLTKVHANQDPLGGRFANIPGDHSIDFTEIAWHEEDALPFPLCVSANTDKEAYQDNMSVALGNVVLADHGRTLEMPEELGPVPPATERRTVEPQADRCGKHSSKPRLPHFRPQLKKRPITQVGHVPVELFQNGNRHVQLKPFDPNKSAAAVFQWEAKHILPAIQLKDSKERAWEHKHDLLSSDEFDLTYLVEVENDGNAVLRFGDDQHGLAPKKDLGVEATYRVGNGSAGNIGASSLAHIVIADSHITGVTNPLPAQGGTEPESMEEVRQRAPIAFRTQERAVTAEDYVRVAEQLQGVQRAAATFRWTGSWYTVFLTVDRVGGLKVDERFKQELRRHLERYRLVGRDVEVDDPLLVPLEIDMHVCAKPDYFRGQLKAALLQEFSARSLPDGRQGFFHPDQFTFGQPVYLSRLYDRAQAVSGVAAVQVTTFQRQDIPTRQYLDAGKLTVAPREIVRLDNDKNFPEHGVFRLTVGGGK